MFFVSFASKLVHGCHVRVSWIGACLELNNDFISHLPTANGLIMSSKVFFKTAMQNPHNRAQQNGGNSSSGSQNVFLALRKIQVPKHTAHDRGFTGGFGFSLDSSEDTDTSDMFSLYPSSPPSILLGKNYM